jgi:hypothetical protein
MNNFCADRYIYQIHKNKNLECGKQMKNRKITLSIIAVLLTTAIIIFTVIGQAPSVYPNGLEDDEAHPNGIEDDEAHPNGIEDDEAHSDGTEDDETHPDGRWSIEENCKNS